MGERKPGVPSAGGRFSASFSIQYASKHTRTNSSYRRLPFHSTNGELLRNLRRMHGAHRLDSEPDGAEKRSSQPTSNGSEHCADFRVSERSPWVDMAAKKLATHFGGGCGLCRLGDLDWVNHPGGISDRNRSRTRKITLSTQTAKLRDGISRSPFTSYLAELFLDWLRASAD